MAKTPIHLDKGNANPDSCPLSKKNKDEAEWFSDDDAYTVDFKGDSPFQEGDFFSVPATRSKGSGPLKEGVRERKYRYVVTKAGAAAGQDPEVDVQN